MPNNPKPTVLFVDDEEDFHFIMEALLSEEYRLLSAYHGKEALELIERDPPDLILLDVMMPVMDGYEVFHQLQADPKTADIPVIFLTAMGESAYEHRGIQLGAVDYISKPFNPEILQLRIKNHIELKLSRDKLERMSMTDALTHLHNRRQLDLRLEEEWHRGMRHQMPLTLLMLDIDHFKQYNDSYGHIQGDQCLTQVAGVIEKSLERPSDFAARYGGEEFSILLPETPMDGGIQIAQRVMESVRALQIEHQSSTAASYVTISVGIASIIPDANTTKHELIDAADKNLYLAKESGRDRSEPAENPIQH